MEEGEGQKEEEKEQGEQVEKEEVEGNGSGGWWWVGTWPCHCWHCVGPSPAGKLGQQLNLSLGTDQTNYKKE